MMSQDKLVRTILDFIDSETKTEKEFDELAIELFAYQYANNLPFRQFAIQQGSSPRMAKTWRDIPAVPINAFKSVLLSCCVPDSSGRTFMTSGTTQDGVQGKSYHPNLDVYDRSMVKNFKNRFLSDTKNIKMGIETA